MALRDTDYDRDCPRCGSATTVTDGQGAQVRDCPDCPWWLYKGNVF